MLEKFQEIYESYMSDDENFEEIYKKILKISKPKNKEYIRANGADMLVLKYSSPSKLPDLDDLNKIRNYYEEDFIIDTYTANGAKIVIRHKYENE